MTTLHDSLSLSLSLSLSRSLAHVAQAHTCMYWGYSCQEVLAPCLLLLCKQEVFKSQGFNELSEDTLAFVLQSDRLRMDEEDILGKVTEWATVNSVSVQMDMHRSLVDQSCAVISP